MRVEKIEFTGTVGSVNFNVNYFLSNSLIATTTAVDGVILTLKHGDVIDPVSFVA